MIFIAYNLLKYKENKENNILYRDFVIKKVNDTFPGEEYLLPYSQYSRQQLIEKFNCNPEDITGFFRSDLLFVMSKCNKLVFFPTDTGNIGSGMNLEISCARGHNLPVYGYNKQTDNFSSNFNLEITDMATAHGISGVFYKKVTFV